MFNSILHGSVAAKALLVGLFISSSLALPQQQEAACPGATLTAPYPSPSMAPGFTSRLIGSGFNLPRSLVFDSAGHLIVLEQSVGITVLTLDDNGGECISIASKTTIVSNYTLNHGLQLSADGKTLYASNFDGVMRWPYDPETGTVTGDPQTIITGMAGGDHQTRTLLMSHMADDMILVSRGSDGNIDTNASDITTGHAQIKAFDVSRVGDRPYDFSSQGTVIGWGLRNSVGISEHPVTGGIFSVENSVDNIVRNGIDFHQNDPGDEMNFHGFLNGSDAGVQGKNYGYPTCVTAWTAADVPDSTGLNTGSPIAFGTINDTNSDALCASNTIAPRLTFQAHWAPINLVFNSNGSMGYLASHGSSDRLQPTGYLLVAIPWDAESGEPVAPADSQDSYVPVMSNQDDANCPDGCFRPTGMAFDTQGRLYMTSDTTGEIYIITTDAGGSVNDANGTGSGSSGNSSSTPHQGAAPQLAASGPHGLIAFVVALLATLLLI